VIARPEARATTPRRPSCAAISSARDEPLAATASRVDHWILVEYRGRWGRDVLGSSVFSAELKEHLRGQLDALRHARLLFVKQPERRPLGTRQVFFGTSTPGHERLFRLEVEHQEDLLEVDFISALAAGGMPGAPFERPLFVVCTHGKRDQCCALRGRPLHDALRDEAGSTGVWQSTHVGGDRFAGNVVVLPQGLYYGRVGGSEVGRLVAAHASGRVYLDRYRGRSAYSFPVQAAEQAIRESVELLGIDELVLLGSERRGEEAWTVRFGTADSVHELDVAVAPGDEPVFLTCGSLTTKLARCHRVTAHRVLSR
jgi:hypothetical protein